MLRFPSWLSIQNKWLAGILFALLFFYLILRAILVEPLLDELGSLFWYIQTGNILNENAVLDANNHLLNSFVGHYCYKLFGDHLFVYRFLAIISFPIYYFSSRKIVSENIKQFQLVVFFALISIHWLFDYFSLSRGYAPSVAFFMLSLSFIPSWSKTFKVKYIALILIGFSLSILSNLSMIIPIIFLTGYLFLIFLSNLKHQKIEQKISVFILLSFFGIFLLKIYSYINTLKNAGKLWWGAKDGLWEVTGKSVSQNIFFTEDENIKYLLSTIFIIMIIVFFYHFIKKGLKQYVLELQFWGTGLLFTCLLSFIFMASFMNVNYPQDRVAMYLVILLILSFGSLISELKGLKWLLLVFIWFPISFIVKANLNTTIYSPQDRIHNKFFDEIQKVISPEDVITADYVAHICYAYASRNSDTIKMAVLNHSDSLIGEDYRLESFYGSINNWSGYKCILSDEITKMKLYKRIKSVEEIAIKDTSIQHLESNQMYIPLLTYKFDDNIKFKDFKILVESSISFEEGSLSTNLIEDLSSFDKGSVDYNVTRFDWYFGHKKSNKFNYTRKLKIDNFERKKITVYIYNPDLINVTLDDFSIKFYGLNEH